MKGQKICQQMRYPFRQALSSWDHHFWKRTNIGTCSSTNIRVPADGACSIH